MMAMSPFLFQRFKTVTPQSNPLSETDPIPGADKPSTGQNRSFPGIPMRNTSGPSPETIFLNVSEKTARTIAKSFTQGHSRNDDVYFPERRGRVARHGDKPPNALEMHNKSLILEGWNLQSRAPGYLPEGKPHMRGVRRPPLPGLKIS